MEQLGINGPLLLFQLINFGAIVAVLSALLYKPVRNMLNERTERIEQSIRESEQVKQQLANAKRDYDAEIAKARQEAATILAQARDRAKAQEAEIVAQAREEADRIREDGRIQASRERDQMLREIKGQLAELVTMTATQVLQAELASKGHDRLIDEALAELGKQN
jgi:F-type H+-transporting ATPase subunit b